MVQHRFQLCAGERGHHPAHHLHGHLVFQSVRRIPGIKFHSDRLAGVDFSIQRPECAVGRTRLLLSVVHLDGMAICGHELVRRRFRCFQRHRRHPGIAGRRRPERALPRFATGQSSGHRHRRQREFLCHSQRPGAAEISMDVERRQYSRRDHQLLQPHQRPDHELRLLRAHRHECLRQRDQQPHLAARLSAGSRDVCGQL